MYPKDQNYKMPPEWDLHERTFISWPIQASMSYPEDYDKVCRGYAELVRVIAEFEPVTVIVNPEDMDKVSNLFNEDRIALLQVPHNDSWLRDNGPTFIVDNHGNTAGINWKFNAWGNKFAAWELDDRVAPEILKHYGIPCFDAPLVMEGGSIHVDGEGTLITTEECLLNPNRNPDLSRKQIEACFKEYLNIEKVIWLKRGLFGDETDGHVDNIASFAAPGKILMQVCSDPQDENYEITGENLNILNKETDAKGRKLEVIPVQQPPRQSCEGKRLTLSYINFYFVNGGIILPVFGGPAESTDKSAVKTFQAVFPDRRIRTINGNAIIKEGGNIHCITQQMPAGNRKESNNP